ncbi:hypothetical protein NXS19_010875 [Fusarium pseudograminearum]|nr:hypothetical protein NXS19_010875 [Fusarium pseudograminearum]
MLSYNCQICGVDMAIARIRTADEPQDAAWNIDGANYIGWSNRFWEGEAKDEECRDCTTIDRTPADPQILLWESLPCWPEDDDPNDPDWLPGEDSQTDSDPLEYDSGYEQSDDNESDCDRVDRDSVNEDHDGVNELCPMSQLCDQPRPERLPNGTWYNNKIFYTGNRQAPIFGDFPGENAHKVPSEHIASPSCQSLQGINGHRLSVAEMKNCRNVRFLIPKLHNWKLGDDERLMEEDSLFCLSGESNGSNVIEDRYFVPWKSFYPPRNGLRELSCSWQMINEGADGSDALYPLPVHSYCLDIYAKASYQRMGKVDLDGLWHWREIETQLHSDQKSFPNRAEISKAREHWDFPWRHYTGDEWLAANPVEVPGMNKILKSCLDVTICQRSTQREASIIHLLPKELLDQIFDLLSPTDINSVANTCHKMYQLAQSRFREIVRKDMTWLWEILEGSQYPDSPDRPVAWDPLCPLGIPPPNLPVGLEKEEAEDELWAEIIAEYPEMEEVANAVKVTSTKRRDEILAPYEEKLESLSQMWQDFRAGVETWIRSSRNHTDEVDWGRTWRIFNPKTTLLPGVRNRARIWEDCQQIMCHVASARESGQIDKMYPDLLAKLADPSHPGWSMDPDVNGW